MDNDKETFRIEAFSDAVIAIVITLLAIDIKVPQLAEGERLLDALLDQWPVYLGFLTSFTTILIMWINHHELFKLIKKVDQVFLILNGFLMMSIALVPFSTLLLVEYIQAEDRHVAALVYSGVFVVTAIFFNVVWRYAAANHRLLGEAADPLHVDFVTKQYRYGPIFYGVAFGLAAVNVPLSILVNLGLAAFFAIPHQKSKA